MSYASTLILGGIAGLTIFLGLPVARFQNLKNWLKVFLSSTAVGILVFLLWDILGKGSEPIEAALEAAKNGGAVGDFILLFVLFIFGFGAGLISLVYFDRLFTQRAKADAKAAPVEASPRRIAVMIAIGIGLHNFSEGLAIGQASKAGSISLALVLIVGFGLHNATEGFGIAAPLTAGKRSSWMLLGILGLIAGLPTFLGTAIGYSIYSVPIFVFCLALAAGSILFVVAELINVGRRFDMREIAFWGIIVGFTVAYITDMILIWGGA